MKKVSIVIIIIVLAILGYYYYQNRTITLTIKINGNNLTNDTKVSCNTKFKDHTCSVMLPTLIQKENQFLAYNTISNTNQVLYDQKQIITITNNIKLYVIEEETIELKLNIDLNGANSINNEPSCITTKRINKCTVKLPNGIRDNGEIIGYDIQNNSKNPKYKVGDEIEITNNNMNLYVISKKVINLNIKGYDYLEDNNPIRTCELYNKEDSCSIKLPMYYNIGYINTKSYDLNGKLYKYGDTITIKNDSILTTKPSQKEKIGLNKDNISYSFDMVNLVYQNTCVNSKELSSYINKIKNIAPYLFYGTTTIEFLNDNTFNQYMKDNTNFKNSNNFVGVTTNHKVDIKCTQTETPTFRYGTIVHELTHSKVFEMNEKLGKSTEKIAQDLGLYNLFLKYKTSANRPIRSYAYQDINEFIAEGYAYYYLQTKEKVTPYTTTEALPSDLIEGFNKLDCVIKNEKINSSNYNACL